MPTKPGITYVFATNATYTTGPFFSLANKAVPADIPNGFVPASDIDAESTNYMLNVNGLWITDWISQGTSAADLDAHIVETDANGQAEIGVLAVGNTASGFGPLTVTSNSGAPATPTAEFINLNTSTAVSATTGGPSASAILGQQTGGGPGVTGLSSAGGGTGVTGFGNGAGHGVSGTGGATGNGVRGISGGSGSGVYGDGGAATAAGVTGLGGTIAGVGVVGTPQDDDSSGVQGETTGTSTTLASAVRGITAGGDAAGVTGNASAGNGYGVVAWADETSPQRAPLRIVPQDDDPSSPQEGDLTYNSTTDETRAYVNSRWQTLWSTQDGFTRGISLPGTGSNNSATWTTLVTQPLPAPYEPKHAGTVLLIASMEEGSVSTARTDFEVRIRDVTAGVDVYTQTIDHPNAAAGPIYDRSWIVQTVYNLPAAGARTFELQFRRTGSGGTGIQARDANLTILGVY